jgi:hypothetical protein
MEYVPLPRSITGECTSLDLADITQHSYLFPERGNYRIRSNLETPRYKAIPWKNNHLGVILNHAKSEYIQFHEPQ